jgi:hypothetical protein
VSKYIHKPDGIDAMLLLAGLAARWVPIRYYKGARINGTGCWQVFTTDRPLIAAHMMGDESFESWVAIIQQICRRREKMKETST